MEIESIEPFKGTVRVFNCSRVNGWHLQQYSMDAFWYGMDATDEYGKRVDPKLIRQKTDGTYVIISYKK